MMTDVLLIIKTIYSIQTGVIDSGLPYTDSQRAISAGALARLTLLNLQYKINYTVTKFRSRGPIDPTLGKL